jgi:UDP-2,4-diacetamido-2,4,6-trideoxy-beta-L-altropyranose hydrolase
MISGTLVAFRVDASLQMGSGHVMRCLTLADALQAAGAHCLFVCRPHPGHLVEKIREKHRCIELPVAFEMREPVSQGDISAYSSWLGCSWETDASQTCEALQDLQVDWLVVDHYALDSRWEQGVQAVCGNICVIDDLADRRHHCALLLDQNLGRAPADYVGLVSSHCVSLTGPHFALLRDEFAAARRTSLERRSQGLVGNLLVSLGGADADNATSAILQALGQSDLSPQCAVTVVLGPQNPWSAQVKEVAATLPFQAHVVVNSSAMAALMDQADLAIGAAGVTSWERCCLGLPTILLTLAANQIPSAVALQAEGAALYIGGPECIGSRLPAAIDSLLYTPALQAMSGAAALLCDGLGARRVIDQFRNSAA